MEMEKKKLYMSLMKKNYVPVSARAVMKQFCGAATAFCGDFFSV